MGSVRDKDDVMPLRSPHLPPPTRPRRPSATRLSYGRIRLNPSTGRTQGIKTRCPEKWPNLIRRLPGGGGTLAYTLRPPAGGPSPPSSSPSLLHPSPPLALTGYMIREGPNAYLIMGCSSITIATNNTKIKKLNK